jgi:hypothetical protein
MTNAEALVLIKKNPISFGCMAASFALAVAVYLRSEVIPEAEAQLTQKSAEAERIALNIQYAAQLKEQADALVAANKEIEARIIRASKVGNNTQYFFKLEKDTGVKITDFRQTTAAVAKPAKGSYAPVGFSVTIQGTLSQLLDFVRQLENGAHYGRVLTAGFTANVAQRSAPLSLGLSVELLGLP